VSWLKYAQYDASIEQPLIRNAGEALGVTALLNLSGDYAADRLLKSSVDVTNLHWIEKLLAGPDPTAKKTFGGLTSPRWPSQILGDAWKIDPERVERGRKIYAELCAECHLGPVNDKVFDEQYPKQSIWSSPRWQRIGDETVLNPVQKSAKGMGTDPAQANVLATRTVQVPGFLGLRPTRDLADWWGCKNLPQTSSTDMPYSLALMDIVDRVSRKSMDDAGIPEEELAPELPQQRPRSRRSSGARTVVSGAAAERRLGYRALSPQRLGAVALLDAQAGRGAPDIVLHGQSRLRSERGRLPRGRQRVVVQDRSNAIFSGEMVRHADLRQQRARPFLRGHAGSGQAGRHRAHVQGRRGTLRSDRVSEDVVAVRRSPVLVQSEPKNA
jgi:hypothetical protein